MTDNPLRVFKARYGLSDLQMSQIFCVQPGTLRRYMRDPHKSSSRDLNPIVGQIINWINQSGLSIHTPEFYESITMNNADFDSACCDRGDNEIALLLNSDRSTVNRWRRTLEVSPPAAKLIWLMNLFGSPPSHGAT